eukprot:Rhum_TRINITY_DN16677_c0_g2::Rhum_TRINITY_DN16677_c0_g2_i1::g.164007::m.164007
MSNNSPAEIKTMKLYNDMERISNELREEGCSLEEGSIPRALLHKITMLSYSGSAGCQHVVDCAGLTPDSKVLDLGSGLGGPARVVSEKAGGCAVVGVEYQKDLSDLCATLCTRSGMDADVVSIAGDGCAAELPARLAALPGRHAAPYDATVSWLVILHIPVAQRPSLFDNLAAVMRPGATLYIEDFYAEESFSEEHRAMLADDVAIPDGVLPTRAQYEEQVKKAGFGEVAFEDVTDTWASFVAARHDEYMAAKERHCRVHSEATYEKMNHFYTAMRTLFTKSPLRGVRLIAKRS